MARNVATLVDVPRSPRREMTPFTPKEARTFLEAVRGHRLKALFTVGVALGLRQGEILGLHWQDVDIDAGTLTVRTALQRLPRQGDEKHGHLAFVEPRSAKSRCTVALPAVVVTSLKAHRVRQLEERLKVGPAWQEHGLVFATLLGTPLAPRNVTRSFRALVTRSKLPAQISLTMDTYSHLMPTLQTEAASKMAVILTPVAQVQ